MRAKLQFCDFRGREWGRSQYLLSRQPRPVKALLRQVGTSVRDQSGSGVLYSRNRLETILAEDDVQFWVALTRIEGLGVRGAHKLIEHIGSPRATYTASLTELES